MSIVGNVQLHEFVQSTESIAETGVLNTLFVRYHVVVKCFQAWQRIHHEVTITGDVAHGVGKESYVQDLGHAGKRLQVLPFLDIVLV